MMKSMIDASNLEAYRRKKMLELEKQPNCPTVTIACEKETNKDVPQDEDDDAGSQFDLGQFIP